VTPHAFVVVANSKLPWQPYYFGGFRISFSFSRRKENSKNILLVHVKQLLFV
jgi:hypothetical protein